MLNMDVFRSGSYEGAVLCLAKSAASCLVKAPQFIEILEVLQFTMAAASRFWRAVYNGGLWLPQQGVPPMVRDGWQIIVALLPVCEAK